jgi:hypothetical protein
MTLRTAVLLALAGLATVFLAACGSDNSVSSASLKPQLLKASAVPGYGLQRTLDWNDPVDLVGQGIFLPELTKPSAALKVVKTAGLRGAAGEVLSRGAGLNTSEITIGVAKFKSADSANKVRDWMHGQDLQQPCAVACIFRPHPAKLPGVRSGRLVVQSSYPTPPPGAPADAKPVGGPPTNYEVEFTVGPYLYFAWTQGSPNDKAKFIAGAQRYYRQVSGTHA